MGQIYEAIARGEAAPLLIACFSAVVLRFVVLDAYEGTGLVGRSLHVRPLMDGFASCLPEGVKKVYDPSRDHEFNLMALGAISGYVVMSFFVCSVLDLFPKVMSRHKVQGHKNFFTPGEWTYTVSIALGNMFIFSWLATVPIWHLQRSGSDPRPF